MKKLLLLMLSAFVMFACTNDNNAGKDDNGKDPVEPGKPDPSEMKYVSKITVTHNDDGESVSNQIIFGYDAENRVVKMDLGSGEAQDAAVVKYETGKVTTLMSGYSQDEGLMEDGVLIPGKKVRWTETMTATLNADGYMESAEMISTAEGEADKKSSFTNIYDGGYLKKITAIEQGDEPYVSSCIWGTGNMISIADGKGDARSTATYDTKNLNNPKCNLDLNWSIYHDEFFSELEVTVFDVLGYCGKRSANMVSSTKNKNEDYTYQYTYDAAGFVTKIVTNNVKENKLVQTMVVEYK